MIQTGQLVKQNILPEIQKKVQFNAFFVALISNSTKRKLDVFTKHPFSNYKITRCCLCYLFTYFFTNNRIYTSRLFLVRSKVFTLFHYVSFFHCNFSNNFTRVLCFSLFWRFAFLFFSLGSRSRRRRWLTHFQHFTSSHLLVCQHFRNKVYVFMLIFVASVGNIKSRLTFHTTIIYLTEVFSKESSVNVLTCA